MKQQLVLVGLTNRPEGRAALRAACDQARLTGARLHVIRIAAVGQTENPSKVTQTYEEAKRARAEGAQLVTDLAAEGLHAEFELQTSHMSPARALLRSATELNADLIVIGLRRRSPVGKLMLGSMSQEILLGADCPVLAVKSLEEG